MKNPCPNCVLKILCAQICIFREEYTQLYENRLKFYEDNCKKSGHIKNFNKKYWLIQIRVEKIREENKKLYSTSSTTSSYGWSISSSSQRESRYKWMINNKVKKKDYLKEIKH